MSVEGLSMSTVYLAIATENYFKSANCFAEKMLAIDLGKPIFVALKKGAKISRGYFRGAKVIKICVWDSSIEEVVGPLKNFINSLEGGGQKRS